jgi:hypothetical protein
MAEFTLATTAATAPTVTIHLETIRITPLRFPMPTDAGANKPFMLQTIRQVVEFCRRGYLTSSSRRAGLALAPEYSAHGCGIEA